ncbi:proton-coupled zinc antiporter SLC30A2-like [Periplaneta americana]|uniref:proton-coupled zinc antiporter SLC30A2-like n=1 Tax=Periplaneta americana TaxID=6978 RepID=UPI0037E8CE77
MANFYDETNVCEHQYSGRINPLSEDIILLEEESRSSLPLLGNSDEPATFCVRCRSMSNSSFMTNHDTELRNPAAMTEWDNRNIFPHECNGHDTVFNSSLSSQYIITSTGDGADMPLLTDGEGFGNVAVNPSNISSDELDHCHITSSSHGGTAAWQQLLAATVMCLLFMVAEVVGGYLAGSLAVMSDAAHLLSDFVGFLVSLFALWLGRRTPTRRLSFGYHRAEILGALLSITIIWVMTGGFVYLAVLRVVHQDFTIKADTMMVVAAIGVVINIVMGLVLHGACHGLGHRHSHRDCSKHQRNINVRAAVIHVLGDLIQSVGVLVSAIVIKFFPEVKLVDPICTFLFSLLVLATTLPVLRDAAHVLMEGFPRHLDYSLIVSSLHSLEGVQAVHSLHVWSLTLNKNALAVHLAVDRSADSDLVLQRALCLVRRKFDIQNATVQVERYCAATMQNCMQCQILKD